MNLTSYAELAVRLANSASPAGDDPDPLGDIDGYRALVADQPQLARAVTRADLDALRGLRAEMTAVFTDAAGGHEPVAVERLNALLIRHPIQPELVRHDDEPWHVHLGSSGSAADRYAATAIHGLTMLISQAGLSQLGVCSIASCPRVFIDASSNRARGYCPRHGTARANVTTIRATLRTPAAGGTATAAG